jgi:outer membrane lipase/esterase
MAVSGLLFPKTVPSQASRNRKLNPITPETGEWSNTMRRTLWNLSMAACLGIAPLAAQTASPTFTHLYVFGDSYCDVGNIFIATSGAQPAAPYYNGRFSNGPIWVDHVAGYLGLPLKPSLMPGGTDFAFGGAEVTAPVVTPEGTIPSVPQQVALYLVAANYKADPNALYILEGGGNDILNANTSGSPQQLGYEIALGIAESELLLRQAGARHFLIPNLFNVGLLPAARTNPTLAAFAAAASTATNQWLAKLLALESLLEGVHIVRLDVFDLMNAITIQTNLTHFGFINVTTPCLTTTVCGDPDHTLFWDVEHPTEFGHAFFAVVVENTFATQPW